MKITIKNPKESALNLMRKVGYFSLGESFVRPLERSGYPRFHIYIKENKEEIILDLHLDQKRPVYKTAHDHAAEYEGKVVEAEAERIKQILK